MYTFHVIRFFFLRIFRLLLSESKTIFSWNSKLPKMIKKRNENKTYLLTENAAEYTPHKFSSHCVVTLLSLIFSFYVQI